MNLLMIKKLQRLLEDFEDEDSGLAMRADLAFRNKQKAQEVEEEYEDEGFEEEQPKDQFKRGITQKAEDIEDEVEEIEDSNDDYFGKKEEPAVKRGITQKAEDIEDEVGSSSSSSSGKKKKKADSSSDADQISDDYGF